jgi:hypothetical protein
MIIFIIFLLNILQSKSIILKDFCPRPKQVSNVLDYRQPLYIIISKESNSVNELIDFMDSNKLKTLHINKDLLTDQYMDNIKNKIPVSFINKDPLIFEDEMFVGSYFEIYNQMKYI